MSVTKITKPRNPSVDIDQYFSYMRGMFDSGRAATFEDFSHVLKRLIYVAFIDSLSKIAFPDEKSNRHRFSKFIEMYCNWADCRRISLPRLVELLSRTDDNSFVSLKSFCSGILNKWQPASRIPLNEDPSLEEIKELLLEDVGKKKFEINNTPIESLSHGSILYSHRNSVVHELIVKGLMDVIPNDYPNYTYVYNFKINEEYWAVRYPISFLETLCIHALDNLESYLRENNLSPFENLDAARGR